MADEDTTPQGTTATAEPGATPAEPNPAQGGGGDGGDWQAFQNMLSRHDDTDAEAGGESADDDTAPEGDEDAEAQPEQSGSDETGDEAEAAGEQDADADAEGEPSEDEDAQPADATEKMVADPQVARWAEKLGVEDDNIFDTALNGLKREGIFTDDEIVEMYQSDPVRFAQRGLKVAKKQRDNDSYVQKLRNGATDGDGRAEAATEGGQAEPSGAQAASGEDFKQAVNEAISETLSGLEKSNPVDDDNWGENVKQTLGVTLTTLAEKVGEQARSEFQSALSERDQKLQNLEQQNRQLQVARVNDQLESARRDLTERYEDLKDDDAHQRVLKRYDTLVDSQRYNSVREAYEEAARWELGETSARKLKERMMDRSGKRKKGQPKAPSGSKKKPQLSPEEKDWQAFNEISRKHDGEHAA